MCVCMSSLEEQSCEELYFFDFRAVVVVVEPHNVVDDFLVLLAATVGHHDHQQEQEDRGREGGDEVARVIGDVIADVCRGHTPILTKDPAGSTVWPHLWFLPFKVSACAL